VRPAEVGPAEVSFSKIGPAEVRTTESGIAEVHPTQHRPTKVENTVLIMTSPAIPCRYTVASGEHQNVILIGHQQNDTPQRRFGAVPKRRSGKSGLVEGVLRAGLWVL
jgi:hypothetical protein